MAGGSGSLESREWGMGSRESLERARSTGVPPVKRCSQSPPSSSRGAKGGGDPGFTCAKAGPAGTALHTAHGLLGCARNDEDGDPSWRADSVESQGCQRHRRGRREFVTMASPRSTGVAVMSQSILLHRVVLAALVAAAPCVASATVSIDAVSCDVHSDYDLTIEADRVVFEREQSAPLRVEMSDGLLWIDGELLDLSSQDRGRVRAFETRVRALVPEVRAIGIEALDVAYTALTEVASALSDEPEALNKRLAASRAELESHFLGSDANGFTIDEKAVEVAVETMVGEFVPVLVGQITTAAIAAALTGDEQRVKQIEARAKAMETRIEQEVEARADRLEARAEALCPKLIELDDIENAFDIRLDDGSPLALMEIERDRH
ncbi:MAG TPA: hypothetical protein DDZ76_05775 [Xanthomonadales bacterium]|nr:hypothetical protein [Xanthomonadales bacterium]